VRGGSFFPADASFPSKTRRQLKKNMSIHVLFWQNKGCPEMSRLRHYGMRNETSSSEINMAQTQRDEDDNSPTPTRRVGDQRRMNVPLHVMIRVLLSASTAILSL
jgi:hypothetical protein